MPTLAYSVRDQQGKLLRGSSEARSKEELTRSLHAKGLIVISIEESKGTVRITSPKRKMHRGVKLDDLTLFARQLAVLLESGITILKAINMLQQQIESVALQQACKKIEEDLKTGTSLKDAISKHPKVFTQMWPDLIETGEATGQLAFVLRQLADYFELARGLKKKVVSALMYPAVLIAVSIAAIFIFMYKVIPIFAEIYKSFGGELPWLTTAVINFSAGLQKHLLKGVVVLVVSGFAFAKYIKTEKGRRDFDYMKLNMPVVGGLFKSFAIERFSAALGILIKGGISIVHALEVATRATANKIMEEALEKVKLNVVQGKPMSVPMAEIGLFPPLVTQMIAVGEESGRLAQLLDEISKFYNEDVSMRITRLTALFEPSLLVIMGGVIGILVAAMYLPIFKMATLFGGG